jgi:inner membrane transporter RhtA
VIAAEAADEPGRLADRIPATWLVIGGILSVQVGAAIAKNLFPLVPPTAMVWMRLATSALILLLLYRPPVRHRSRVDWTVALAFGVALLGMNWSIYQSFARIPLGMAVTIEFLGPLCVAVLGSRRPADLAWVALAGTGVLLLGFTPHGLTWAGVGFALMAGLFWGAYILLSERTGRHWPGVTGLTVASMVGAVALAPAAIAEAGRALLNPTVLGLGVAVGLLSSVIPYSLELTALRRMPPRLFGVLMSIEPAAAAIAAMVILGEFLRPMQWVALACVVTASVGASRTQSQSRPTGGAEG